MGWGYSDYVPRVSVAQRRAQARRELQRLVKQGEAISPITIQGRKIASTFWGKAWCENLEAYSDYANRLPRGRSYVRNGSVVHLAITPRKVQARVSGSELYQVTIEIDGLDPARWSQIKSDCAGQIDTLVELLQGKLPRSVIEVITRKPSGLFPAPREIKLRCSCPDRATMCKHVAATLYGVGARLDHQPDLLFLLRGVDALELLSVPTTAASPGVITVESTDLSALFGIDLEPSPDAAPPITVPEVVTRAAPKARKRAAPKARKPAAPKVAKPVSLPKPTPKPRAIRGPRIAPVFTPEQVCAKDLVAVGVPHSQIQRWLRTGILQPSGQRGVYESTPTTAEELRSYVSRKRR